MHALLTAVVPWPVRKNARELAAEGHRHPSKHILQRPVEPATTSADTTTIRLTSPAFHWSRSVATRSVATQAGDSPGPWWGGVAKLGTERDQVSGPLRGSWTGAGRSRWRPHLRPRRGHRQTGPGRVTAEVSSTRWPDAPCPTGLQPVARNRSVEADGEQSRFFRARASRGPDVACHLPLRRQGERYAQAARPTPAASGIVSRRR